MKKLLGIKCVGFDKYGNRREFLSDSCDFFRVSVQFEGDSKTNLFQVQAQTIHGKYSTAKALRDLALVIEGSANKDLLETFQEEL